MTQSTQTRIRALAVERYPGIVCKGHYFDVPLDYKKPDGQGITVFAREVVSTENEGKEDLPWLVFLQGGPGFESPRPESAEGWIKRAVAEYRVLLLDQRGTGLSTPLTHETISTIGDVNAQFEYAKQFRADNIVRDCETIRKSLGGNTPWTVLGQSFGGFCITTYLSIAPEGLSGAILAGGVPALVDDPDEVYRGTYKQLIQKNLLYYERFPEDKGRVRQIVDFLEANNVLLPTGERLSARRFLQLGINFGFNCSGGSMNTVHYLIERAFVETPPGLRLSYLFLRGVDALAQFNTNPIYAILHEAIYCQNRASNWSAQRILEELPEFDLKHEPVFFTGEMIYPTMFDDFECLKPLKELAQKLAQFTDWPALYNVELLRKNTVPCVASIYYNDLYVDRVLAEQTAANIRGIKLWITNEYEHDAIRVDGEKVLDRLLKMLTDKSR